MRDTRTREEVFRDIERRGAARRGDVERLRALLIEEYKREAVRWAKRR
jgi:hypothetical protein